MAVSHQELARRLREAGRSGPVEPLRDGLAPTDADGAYAVQRLNTEHWIAHGRRRSGRKIGLTAVAVQRQLGVDQPDFGVLFDDMAVLDGDEAPIDSLFQPKAEAEIALVLKRDLASPKATPLDVLAAVDHVLPAIEIVDSRIADWRITFADTVADNASAALYVLGRAPRSIRGLDLYACGMVLEADGRIVSSGVGAACLGHPLNAAAWLARTLAARGDPLREGEVVLTGALGPMTPLANVRHLRAVIGGVGDVGFRCEAAA